MFNIKICSLVVLALVLVGCHSVSSRPVNKTQESLDAKIRKNKLLAKWIMQKETDLNIDIDKLKPADHLEGIRMEQDGHLNSEYQREIFLGNHEHGPESDTEAEITLKDIFKKADIDRDGFLSQEEIEEWIEMKIDEHLDVSEGENSRIFNILDSNNDGFISWIEYLKQFMLVHGHDSDIGRHNDTDYTIKLGKSDQKELERYKRRWQEADNDPSDDKLSEKEFLTFRHPEHSETMLEAMVEDILAAMDKDNDKELSLKEFVSLPEGLLEDPQRKEMDDQWQLDREEEFKNDMDTNGDGIVSKLELKDYIDPRNQNHAKSDALTLLRKVDENKDGRLSLEEVLRNKDILLGSKMVDTGRSFHDEF